MKYTEQAVETLDDAGSVIANRNIEIEQLRQRVHELEKEPSVESGGEFKTWWEIALHVGAWKNHELDYVHFGSEMAVRAFAIHLLKQRDKEESQLIQTIAKLTAERDKATQYWQIAEGRCDALFREANNRCDTPTDSTQILAEVRRAERERVAELEKERDRLSELCDKWHSECDDMREANNHLANVADALKQQRDELLAALERSLESFEYIAKYGNSCGHSQLRIPDLKAVIASVKEKA